MEGATAMEAGMAMDGAAVTATVMVAMEGTMVTAMEVTTAKG